MIWYIFLYFILLEADFISCVLIVVINATVLLLDLLFNKNLFSSEFECFCLFSSSSR